MHTRLYVHAYVYMPSNETSQGPSRMAAQPLPLPKRDARKTHWSDVEQQKTNKKKAEAAMGHGSKAGGACPALGHHHARPALRASRGNEEEGFGKMSPFVSES